MPWFGGVGGLIRVIPDRFERFLVDWILIRVVPDRFGRFLVKLIDGGWMMMHDDG